MTLRDSCTPVFNAVLFLANGIVLLSDPLESLQVLATKSGRYSVRVIEASAVAARIVIVAAREP